MSLIISLVNQKGGVGKTTLSTHIATALAARKKRVLLVDADPQGSALDWEASREGRGGASLFAVMGLPKRILHVELPKLAGDYDVIIIDGPPRIYEVSRSAIGASNVVLIPVQPSQYDVWAAEETVKLVQECIEYNSKLKAAFVINRKIANTAIGRDVKKALARYASVPVLKATVTQRVAFAESATQGRTVFELGRDSMASKEINALVQEVIKLAG
jgi:chromosome partitioning protein